LILFVGCIIIFQSIYEQKIRLDMTPEEIMTIKGLKKQHNQAIETGNRK
jgi:hypothetical protein